MLNQILEAGEGYMALAACIVKKKYQEHQVKGK